MHSFHFLALYSDLVEFMESHNPSRHHYLWFVCTYRSTLTYTARLLNPHVLKCHLHFHSMHIYWGFTICLRSPQTFLKGQIVNILAFGGSYILTLPLTLLLLMLLFFLLHLLFIHLLLLLILYKSRHSFLAHRSYRNYLQTSRSVGTTVMLIISMHLSNSHKLYFHCKEF